MILDQEEGRGGGGGVEGGTHTGKGGIYRSDCSVRLCSGWLFLCKNMGSQKGSMLFAFISSPAKYRRLCCLMLVRFLMPFIGVKYQRCYDTLPCVISLLFFFPFPPS